MHQHSLFPVWSTDVAPAPTDAAHQAFDELVAAYQSPGRFYHALDHIADVLRTIDFLSDDCGDRTVVRLAAWYHDAVYDSHAGDNEERSADMARAALGRLAIHSDTIERVANLILTTKTHQMNDDPDAAVLLDADLAILGAKPDHYDEYARMIRQEYGWVADDAFRSGRAAILRRFVERQAIFRTPKMRASHEDLAREKSAKGNRPLNQLAVTKSTRLAAPSDKMAHVLRLHQVNSGRFA